MNASDLRQQLSRIFCCVDGPPRAYFEFPQNGETIRIIYGLIAVAMRGEPDNVETILCLWALTKLSDLLTPEQRDDASVVLFWRRHPSIDEFADEKGRTCTRLRMRLCIPGYDLSEITKQEGDAVRWL